MRQMRPAGETASCLPVLWKLQGTCCGQSQEQNQEEEKEFLSQVFFNPNLLLIKH